MSNGHERGTFIVRSVGDAGHSPHVLSLGILGPDLTRHIGGVGLRTTLRFPVLVE